MIRQFGSCGINLDDVSSFEIQRDIEEPLGSGSFFVDQDKIRTISEYQANTAYPNHVVATVTALTTKLTVLYRSIPQKKTQFVGHMAELVFDSLCADTQGFGVYEGDAEIKEDATERLRSFRAIRISFQVVGDSPNMTVRQLTTLMWENYSASEEEHLRFPVPDNAMFMYGDEEIDPGTHVSEAPRFHVKGRQP